MLINKFSNLLNNKSGKYMISIIIGLGIASLFRKVCDDYNCIVYKGVVYDEVKDNTYEYNSTCYKYDVKPVTCNSKKKIFNFA
jgi:hypothetical protein